MKIKHILLPAALSFLLLGAGCSMYKTVVINTTANVNQQNANTTVNANSNAGLSFSYQGQDGKNALELLQTVGPVDVSDAGFVNAINGIKPGDRQFWAFYVNGQQAQVGAKEYQTKSTDTIEWKLEAY